MVPVLGVQIVLHERKIVRAEKEIKQEKTGERAPLSQVSTHFFSALNIFHSRATI